MDGAVDLAMHNTAFDIYQVTTPYLPLTLSSVKESRELQVIIIILLTRRLGIPPQITQCIDGKYYTVKCTTYRSSML